MFFVTFVWKRELSLPSCESSNLDFLYFGAVREAFGACTTKVEECAAGSDDELG